MDSTAEVFLLTRDWRDTPRGLELVLWATGEEGPVRVVLRGQEAVCFLPRGAGIAARSAPAAGEARNPRRRARRRPLFPVAARARGIPRRLESRLYESDVRAADRFLMERFVTGPMILHGRAERRERFLEFVDPRVRAGDCRPPLRAVSLDIETSGLDGDDRRERLWSIAVSGSDARAGSRAGAGGGAGGGARAADAAGRERRAGPGGRAEAVFLVDAGADPTEPPSPRLVAGDGEAPVHRLPTKPR